MSKSQSPQIKPRQTAQELSVMEEYLANGAQLGWLIDPLEKKVYVCRPKMRVKVLHHPKTISGEPLLKGLALGLAGILD